MNEQQRVNSFQQVETLSATDFIQEEIDSLIAANDAAGKRISSLEIEIRTCKYRIEQRHEQIRQLQRKAQRAKTSAAQL